MSWNEPPGGNKGKDPWGDRGNGDGPPDLDEIVRKMRQGIGGLFGNKPSATGGGGFYIALFLIILALTVYIASDVVYFIDQQERGIVLRFGAYNKTWQPGLNFRLPTPLEEVIKVNVAQVRSISHKAHMLTQDENIVDVEVAVQWRIKEPADFLFNVSSPTMTLRQVTESALREVIGKSELDYVLTEGRGQIAQDQLRLIQLTLDQYKTGILISTVEMQPAKPPEEVKAAFDDAIKAREDEQRFINVAEAYRNDVIPRARGGAARIREEAKAYKATVIARAEGEASRFDQILTEYEHAPAITRQRLYLDAIETVFSSTSKVLLDVEGSNSLLYLPIDRLIENAAKPQSFNIPRDVNPAVSSAAQMLEDIRNSLNTRARGAR